MIEALFYIVLLVALFGGLMQRLNNRLQQQSTPQEKLIDNVNALLPQLQCGQCHYAGCRPYAEAIITVQARIDLCPPGGMDTVQQLANFLQVEPPTHLPFSAQAPKEIARIDSSVCIGCTLCLPVCPTDAIVGSPRHLHRIIDSYCVGCGLCVAPCPVNCITMQPQPTNSPTNSPATVT